jgi:diguanylate cyclase (GGDEF)-like protein
MQMKEAPRDEVACEAKVLHESSAIQKGAGLLLIGRTDQRILAANQTLCVSYDRPQSLHDVFQRADAEVILSDLQAGIQPVARFLRMQQGEFVWASCFDAEAFVGIDLTYIDDGIDQTDDISQVFANCVQDMSREHETLMQDGRAAPDTYFDLLVQGVQNLSGFDRVMLYQFDPDLNGEVLAEACSGPDVPSFLGLKFPSGDIPKPARNLFLTNKVRQIIEVEGLPEPIVSTTQEAGPVVFNQSNSAFRYTSPIHLDYLTNMGVSASLTIGIVIRRKLWGLLSCHGVSGRRQLAPDKLTLCHVISDLASNHVARLLEKQRMHASEMTRGVLARISTETQKIETPDEFADLVSSFEPDFLRLLNADGLQFESETTNLIIGATPSSHNVEMIDCFAKKWLRDHDRNFVATADLNRLTGLCREGTSDFAGLLHFASWDAQTRLKAFRKAAVQSKTWAGDPNEKERYAGTDSKAMHPRNSFAAYQEKTSGCALVWQEAEIQVARDLLSGLRNIEMTFHKSLRERQLRQSNAEMRSALKKANYDAHHDELTGVHNRRGFEKMLADMSPRKKRDNAMWLFHIDVDHFKKINDTFGHLAGDAILVHVTQALGQSVEGLGTVSRIGGDEFAVILSGGLLREKIDDMCDRFAKFLQEPLFYNGLEVSVTCTMGITTFEAGVEQSSAILNRSDIALYSGKAEGRGTFTFFTPAMENESNTRRILEKEIERAIDADEFIPYFQPQIDVQTKAIVGCEMLCRWSHPQKGVLAPDAFLAAAQAMGMLGEIDRAMFRKAVAVQAHWEERTAKIMPISVNVSFDRLREKELIADLLKLGECAQNFTLELLETIDLDENAIDYEGILKALRATGVGIELDDFGSGRSSILAILKVQPDRLKIDKRLIDPIVGDQSARNVVKSVIEIGSQLGIKAIAEGVESSQQVDILADLACDRIQGYFYGKPQPAEDLEKVIALAAA